MLPKSLKGIRGCGCCKAASHKENVFGSFDHGGGLKEAGPRRDEGRSCEEGVRGSPDQARTNFNDSVISAACSRGQLKGCQVELREVGEIV